MWRTAVHFLLIGLALVAAERLFLGGAVEPPEPIVFDAARVESLRRVAEVRSGRAAGKAELAALVEAEIEEELLVRHARSLGLHESDPVVWNRLVQNMRFAGAAAERAPEELFAEALELGMDRTDVVVRRRLAQIVRLSIEAGARSIEPSEAEVRAYYEANAERFVRPTRVRITHVFFDREHAAQAREAIERLEGTATDVSTGHGLGDPILLSADQPLQSEREIGAGFGEDFAHAIVGLPVGRWVGPVESAYGFHLVYVHERRDSEPLALEEVRDRIGNALKGERAQQAVRAAVAQLRSGVEVRIAESG